MAAQDRARALEKEATSPAVPARENAAPRKPLNHTGEGKPAPPLEGPPAPRGGAALGLRGSGAQWSRKVAAFEQGRRESLPPANAG